MGACGTGQAHLDAIHLFARGLLGANLTGLFGLSAASEKQVLTLKFMTNM